MWIRLRTLAPPIFMGLAFNLAVVACSPMMSIRTDEQAWNQYLNESKSQRLPASSAASAVSAENLSQFDKLPLRSILISCQKVRSPQACYLNKAIIAFDGVYKNHPNYHALQSDFLDHYSYQKMLGHLQVFHQTLFSGMDSRAADHAKALLTQCESSQDSGVRISAFIPYLGGNSDIPKSYYECLNEKLRADQEQLLLETTERLGVRIVEDQTRHWIINQHIHPVYDRVAKQWFKRHLQDEQLRWQDDRAKYLVEFHKGESLDSVVKRLSPVVRESYHYLPAEVALTRLYREVKTK
jgi:hypothetical protein